MASFDENDESLMVPLSRAMAQLARQCFPAELAGAAPARLRVASGRDAETAVKQRLVALIDAGLGAVYAAHNGPAWKTDKWDEMSDPGLVYVWYEHDAAVAAFVSFKLVTERSARCLYLYEIHVRSAVQASGAGTALLGAFHRYSEALARAAGTAEVPESRHFAVQGTGLTVFSANTRALAWYLKHGYSVAPDSPQDRFLRGRRVPPAYYILYRPRDNPGRPRSPNTA